MDNQMTEFMKNRWAVIGFDSYTAKDILEEIEQSCGKTISRKFIRSYEMRTEFTDGTVLRWIPAKKFLKRIKFGKMWCDKNIDREILKCVILPQYFGRYEEIIWV